MKKTWSIIQIAWKKWSAFARILGHIQLRIIFSLFYLVGFSVLGVIFRFFQDPLDLHATQDKKTAFQPWEHPRETLAQAKKPY